jgi:hypothetical protein
VFIIIHKKKDGRFMSEYKDGNSKDQFNKLIRRNKDSYLEEKKKFNFFDLIGTLTGALLGGLVVGSILPGSGIIWAIAGGIAGYFLTPHFVPKFFRWFKKVMKKDKF